MNLRKNNVYSGALLFAALMVLVSACGGYSVDNTPFFENNSEIFRQLTLPDDTGPSLPDDPEEEEADWPEVSEQSQSRVEHRNGFQEPRLTPEQLKTVLAKYAHIDRTNLVPKALKEKAIAYFDLNRALIPNQARISVIDYARHSKYKRFWIINMKTGAVWAMHVAHGKGSDDNHDGVAEKFSNVEGSNATSLGYFLTGDSYRGKWGISMYLDGLSESNNKARPRKIVVHGAPYVREAEVRQGRSWGCPAVAIENRNRVVEILKGGTLMFAAVSN